MWPATFNFLDILLFQNGDVESQLDLSQFSEEDGAADGAANVNAPPPSSTTTVAAGEEQESNSNNQPTLHVISQEGLRLDQDEKMETAAPAANVQYVEYIKEGPMAYVCKL